MKKSVSSSSGTLESAIPSGALDDAAVGSIAASGITIATSTEAELGEFFSQWGLVMRASTDLIPVSDTCKKVP